MSASESMNGQRSLVGYNPWGHKESDTTKNTHCCCCCCCCCYVMSDSVWPHRRQPTRLPRPWDSPGKNTGVGCHFLLQCMKVKVKSLSHVRLLATPWTAAYPAPPPMEFSRQEYWSELPLPSPWVAIAFSVSCHCLLRARAHTHTHTHKLS